jgi:hypothetical protein
MVRHGPPTISAARKEPGEGKCQFGRQISSGLERARRGLNIAIDTLVALQMATHPTKAGSLGCPPRPIEYCPHSSEWSPRCR